MPIRFVSSNNAKAVLRLYLLMIMACAVLFAHCGLAPVDKGASGTAGSPPASQMVSDILKSFDSGSAYGRIDIQEPPDNAVFPKDMAPPLFEWQSGVAGGRRWLIEIRFSDDTSLYDFSGTATWVPAAHLWEEVKHKSNGRGVNIRVYGLGGFSGKKIKSHGESLFYISGDSVGAAIMYRQLPLPYAQTSDYINQIMWKLGDISEEGPPHTVMSGQPVCSGCHQASRDGSLLSMEMNIDGDGGAQWVKRVEKNMVISADDVMTWRGYPHPSFFPKTRGSFAKLSPSGRYIAGCVNEISFMVLTGEPAYSQLFFPTFGFLGGYDRQKNRFFEIKGTQDWDYVHTDPSWFPDESALIFARAETRNSYHPDLSEIKTLSSKEPIDELNHRYPVQFDLLTLPFNGGAGGQPVPLEGACQNGKSNYFGRISPDGKWVAFTRSQSGMMLQPDSELFIVPSEGGEARRMRCNRKHMNSWHTWSPNGRWLAFASKDRSMYTEIYLTHVSDNGEDTPAVRLSRFSSPVMAANIPEFVSFGKDAVQHIQLQNSGSSNQ